MTLRNLYDIGGTVARRELDHAKPIAMRVEPHGLGVDRHGIFIAAKVRQIAAMQTDGHYDVVLILQISSLRFGLDHSCIPWQSHDPTQDSGQSPGRSRQMPFKIS
jgi:hypothetical protein